mgnify:CR=1 FL=1
MKEAIDSLGDKLPPAFFAASDSLAIGALRALQEAGIGLPERVSMISFNDTILIYKGPTTLHTNIISEQCHNK